LQNHKTVLHKLPHASSSGLIQKNEEDQNPSESLVTDPQILRRRLNVEPDRRTRTELTYLLKLEIAPAKYLQH
jgi:hypothetical protein